MSVRRQSLIAALVGLVLSCGVSPTLPPLPPPDEPASFRSTSSGLVLIEGFIPVDEAKVFILNHHTQKIAGQFVHDQEYAIEILAEGGDSMLLWYSASGFQSDTVSFEIPESLPPAEP